MAARELWARIDDLRGWFPAGLPWVWMVSPLDRPSDLPDRLIAAGFHRRRILPAMTRSLADFDPRRGPRFGPDVDVAEVLTAADLEAWLAVRNANHPLDAGTRAAWLRTLPWPPGPAFHQFVARAPDGRAAGSMTLFIDGATAGLYHVDVIASARGQGVGTAMTMAALSVARAAGARLAVLTATELGIALYRSLGFKIAGDLEALAVPG